MKNGGKRAGSGRKPVNPALVKIAVSYKLPRWLVDALAISAFHTGTSRAALIEQALCKMLKVEAPKVNK